MKKSIEYFLIGTVDCLLSDRMLANGGDWQFWVGVALGVIGLAYILSSLWLQLKGK